MTLIFENWIFILNDKKIIKQKKVKIKIEKITSLCALKQYNAIDVFF